MIQKSHPYLALSWKLDNAFIMVSIFLLTQRSDPDHHIDVVSIYIRYVST